ncbi:hypothetical protein [Lysobacter sp. P5_B9]
MTDSVQLFLWQAMFYVLGATGLFAIGALPLRTYMLIRSARAVAQPTLQTALVLVAALTAAALAGQFLLRVGKCLLGFHCSANAAGGWINAAYIGAIYVSFEIVVATIRWHGGRRNVAA